MLQNRMWRWHQHTSKGLRQASQRFVTLRRRFDRAAMRQDLLQYLTVLRCPDSGLNETPHILQILVFSRLAL
jgi:hypothetical protein